MFCIAPGLPSHGQKGSVKNIYGDRHAMCVKYIAQRKHKQRKEEESMGAVVEVLEHRLADVQFAAYGL